MGRTRTIIVAALSALAMALTIGGCGRETYDMGFREPDKKVLSSQGRARLNIQRTAGWGSDVVWKPDRRIEHVGKGANWMEENGVVDIQSCSGGYMYPLGDTFIMTPETCTTEARYDYVLSYGVDDGAVRSFSYDGRKYM